MWVWVLVIVVVVIALVYWTKSNNATPTEEVTPAPETTEVTE